jgi:hypothetical protein
MIEIEMKVKPLTVNQCWKGRRYKSDKYEAYEFLLFYTLPKNIILPPPPYQVFYEFGLSSSLADWDNPIKPLQDILQQKYKFNDKDIELAHVKKVKVAKGSDYFIFRISNLYDDSFSNQLIYWLKK